MQFTDQEIETIKALIRDHGCDYSLETDSAEYQALGEKLGVLAPEPIPTAEELAEQAKRREEFAKSPMGLIMSEMLTRSNKYMAGIIARDMEIFQSNVENGFQWPVRLINPDGSTEDVPINTVGSTLRIRLPNDYIDSKG